MGPAAVIRTARSNQCYRLPSPFEYAFGLSDKPPDEEFGLLRDHGRDSLEVWLFKVPDRKAVEIGNAIWAKWKARAAGHQGPSREPEPPPAL